MALKITKKEMEARLRSQFPNEDFEIIEYSVAQRPGQIKCNKCGNIIYVSKFDSITTTKKKQFLCRKCFYGIKD